MPDCASCEKPELDESNHEAFLLWNRVANQQTYNAFSGARLGLRMEAVVACLNELCEEGLIRDRRTAFDRVWVIDQVVNQIDRIKAEQEEAARKAAASRGGAGGD